MDLTAWKAQLRRGIAEFAVLGCLEHGEAYGLLILETLVTKGVDLSEGSIYPLLTRLQKDGKIESRWVEDEGASHPRKYYRLTVEGRAMLARMKDAWRALQDGVANVLENRA